MGCTSTDSKKKRPQVRPRRIAVWPKSHWLQPPFRIFYSGVKSRLATHDLVHPLGFGGPARPERLLLLLRRVRRPLMESPSRTFPPSARRERNHIMIHEVACEACEGWTANEAGEVDTAGKDFRSLARTGRRMLGRSCLRDFGSPCIASLRCHPNPEKERRNQRARTRRLRSPPAGRFAFAERALRSLPVGSWRAAGRQNRHVLRLGGLFLARCSLLKTALAKGGVGRERSPSQPSALGEPTYGNEFALWRAELAQRFRNRRE